MTKRRISASIDPDLLSAAEAAVKRGRFLELQRVI